MFYILAEENDFLVEKYPDSEQVSNMDIWSDIDTLSENTTMGQLCPKCKQMCSNYYWGPQRRAKFFSSRYPDMLLSAGSGLIFSERAKNLITTHSLLGVVSFDKIDISGKHIPPYGYYDTTICFVESMIDWEHSVIKKSDIRKYSNCELCGLFIDHAAKIQLLPHCHEKMDIFQLYCMPYHFIVSERFHTLFEAANLGNITFIPLQNYSF